MVRERSVTSFYSSLRSAVLSCPSSPLLVFPSSSDADSLCALRAATHVLASDSLPYSVYPVSSFSGLPPLPSSSPCVLLLLNCGAHRDLRRALPPLHPLSRVFVLDSHRPIHLHNLSDLNSQIVVLYTVDDEHHSDLAYDFDVSALAAASPDLASDDDDLPPSASGSDSDSGSDSGSKRRRLSPSAPEPLRAYRKLRSEYYRLGTYHGMPSGCIMYDLAHSLRKNTSELLWLACVALTDQFVHERLTFERYQSGVMDLERHVSGSGGGPAVSLVTLRDGTRIQAPASARIHLEDEPRLMLLREWNLFDSMLCSSYTATKLKTWSDNGAKKLQFLLARMGFALVDCRRRFRYMSVEVKRKMRGEFERLLPEYGLSEFYYRSFVLTHGYGSKVSAADVVYGVTALLEGDPSAAAAERFWDAYSALSTDDLDRVEKGMQRAIQVQRAIVRQGSAAITKPGVIRGGRKFRWVKVEDPADIEQLGRPQALTKFCFFVMDALKERGARMKPLVCACLMREPEKVLVVGTCGRPRLGALQGNAFGVGFRSAAKEIGAEYFHELFESSWIILDTKDVSSFMIKLTEKL